ncbi:carbonic anhydrase [Nannocystis exedens]|uniref:carbonic anhydrase n=1 Tax=Nannocystis exedens TaxID=54 RepID=A0A1I1WJZ6_9BACT|nr:carbonic anhydrase family protein [Nannocystis exedens]PCC67791.1 Carbonic anhydrase precursor [Nannocystis exedens]SFD95319.1 carbonic anhydrase [Nannocystis exedens]
MPAPLVTPQRTQQSPIKLNTLKSYYAPELRPLEFQYTKVAGTLVGEELVLDRAGPVSQVVFDGMKCPLRKLHFHAPGEHRIDGMIAELELHLVHEILEYPDAYPSAYLFVGVMLAPTTDKTAPVHALAPWLRGHFDGRAVTRAARDARQDYEIDPSIYLPEDRAYFRYEGSMTTGDTEEIVTWTVLRDPKAVEGPGPLQLDPKTSRLVQPLMRRYVLRNFALIA